MDRIGYLDFDCGEEMLLIVYTQSSEDVRTYQSFRYVYDMLHTEKVLMMIRPTYHESLDIFTSKGEHSKHQEKLVVHPKP